MNTTPTPQTPAHRQAWACAHAISQHRPVTLKKPAGGAWEIGLCTGPIADLQRRKALIERELKKIKPEEYGPLAQSLFRELTQIKKQINNPNGAKQ